MSGVVDLQRIEAQIQTLRAQVADARRMLAVPQTRPTLRRDLMRVIERAAQDESRLVKKLVEAAAAGRTEFRWAELE